MKRDVISWHMYPGIFVSFLSDGVTTSKVVSGVFSVVQNDCFSECVRLLKISPLPACGFRLKDAFANYVCCFEATVALQTAATLSQSLLSGNS